MGDVLAGRSRTPVEARVLDALWSDRILGRRGIEVRELAPGRVALLGEVRSPEEIGRAVAIAERAKGVREVDARLAVEAGERRRPRRRPRG